MNALPLNNQMFVSTMANMAKTVEASETPQRFTLEHARPYLKSLVGKTQQQKVMALAWKLYKGSQMAGGKFDRNRFALYVSCAHAEVRHENEAAKTLSRDEIRFIGNDRAKDAGEA